jgi:hypothetical protein
MKFVLEESFKALEHTSTTINQPPTAAAGKNNYPHQIDKIRNHSQHIAPLFAVPSSIYYDYYYVEMQVTHVIGI